MMKICKFIFLVVTFFMPKCVYQNPDLNIIIHLDESEDTAEGLPIRDKGILTQNKQIIGISEG